LALWRRLERVGQPTKEALHFFLGSLRFCMGLELTTRHSYDLNVKTVNRIQPPAPFPPHLIRPPLPPSSLLLPSTTWSFCSSFARPTFSVFLLLDILMQKPR